MYRKKIIHQSIHPPIKSAKSSVTVIVKNFGAFWMFKCAHGIIYIEIIVQTLQQYSNIV